MRCNNCNSILNVGDKVCKNCNAPVVKYNLSNEGNNKNNIVLWILLFIFVLIGAGSLAYGYIYNSSSETIFKKVLSGVYKNSLFSSVDDVNTISIDYKVKPNVKLNDADITKVINNISLGGNFKIDAENEIMQSKVNSKYNDKELIDVDMFATSNKAYLYLNHIYDKYISIDLSENEEQVDTNSYVEVFKELSNAINATLKDEYFTEEKTDAIIDNKTISVVKHSLIINNENAKIILSDAINYLKNSDNYLTNLSKINGSTKEEIKNDLDEELKNININEKQEITISIYTNGMMNNVVKSDIVIRKNTKEMLNVAYYNDKITFKITGEEVIEGEIKITKNDSETTINLLVKSEDQQVGLDFIYSIKYNEKISEMERIENSVNIDELTEKDSEKILTKLMENEGIIEIMTAVQEIIGGEVNEKGV